MTAPLSSYYPKAGRTTRKDGLWQESNEDNYYTCFQVEEEQAELSVLLVVSCHKSAIKGKKEFRPLTMYAYRNYTSVSAWPGASWLKKQKLTGRGEVMYDVVTYQIAPHHFFVEHTCRKDTRCKSQSLLDKLGGHKLKWIKVVFHHRGCIDRNERVHH